MPSKKWHESQANQSARFRSEVQRLIDAGELNPTEADAALRKVVDNSRLRPLAEGQEIPENPGKSPH